MAEGSKRQTDLKLKLGSDQIEAVWVDAYEAISQHYQITLDFLSTLGPIKLADYLGKPAAIEAIGEGGRLRYFHGIVVSGRYLATYDGAGVMYRLILRPEAYFHSQGKNFRIFQEKSARDIIKEVLEGCKIDHELKAKGAKHNREYCVQYGESDFSFVCRLMEEEGLYYYYLHEAGRHVLIICDEPSSHPRLAEPTLTYNATVGAITNADLGAGAYVSNWVENVASGAEQKVTYRDYNFKMPRKHLESAVVGKTDHPLDAIEIYNWPGRFVDEATGKDLADYVLDSRRAQRQTFEGASQYAGMQVGHTFALSKHEIDDYNKSYMVISSHVSIAAEQFRPGMQNKGGSTVQFTVIKADVQFRAPMITPHPVVNGPETAVVTGPSGEEIYVDNYGRIKVHFFWDRLQASDEKSSCWIRVSQTGGLGNIIIPRIGHEVLVDFINGDPDKPIVVGRVFNATYMPVYQLPANKTRAVWRSKTYKQDTGSSLSGAKALDTGQPGANEIRFEDKTGEEELFIHAEKNLNTRVRWQESHHVGHDQMIDIGRSRTEEVKNNETIKIGDDRKENVGKNEEVEIGSNQKLKVGSNKTEEVGTDHKHKVGSKMEMEIGSELKIKAGSKITIECGGSSIELTPSGIKINTVSLEMDGSAKSKLSGGMTNVEAMGILTAKGSLVKIN